MLRSLSGLLLSLRRCPSSSLLLRPLYTTASPPRRHPTANDAYFAVVHHIAGIVRRDFYLEGTLNRPRLPTPTPDLVLRVIRAAAPAATLSALRFFSWARPRPSYRPSAAEFDALLLPLSPDSFAAVIDAYGLTALPDLAVEVFNRLPRFSCPQTTPVYNALLSALCRAGNFQCL